MVRMEFIINGQVQGVGFRPFVYRKALSHALTGFVLNNSRGVQIEVQGTGPKVDNFLRALQDDLPPLARIIRLESRQIKAVGDEREFVIAESSVQEGHQVLISPDVCTCEDCQHELFDTSNFRYLYPFINCTNCGPRYTITGSIPYDRKQTSMACFPMCDTCRSEYNDPLDRRFHAQPNACPECGPEVWLTDSMGRKVDMQINPLDLAAELLQKGRVLAIKGLGGFHLACDAANDEAIIKLRDRKKRFGKSLAIMVQHVRHAEYFAHISAEEKELLTGVQRPIVVLCKKNVPGLSAYIAPDTNNVGIMLPYTPLHFVLFKFLQERAGEANHPPALVMTSGNSSSEPICLGNREALKRLAHIADNFVLHNRDILVRCDDSVVFSRSGKNGFYRRARGYTPSPVFLPRAGETVLGTGPELKDTLCLTKGDQAFVSQHIGDLKNLKSYDFFVELANHMQGILQAVPKAIVCDLHPDYLSSRFAREQDELPVFTLQHHFAHIHAAMAENRFEGQCLGLALDGTGLGDDGTIWGGELLLVDSINLEQSRIGSFSPVSMPGGEMAVQEPWRMAKSFLFSLDMDCPLPWKAEFEYADSMLQSVLEKSINCPRTSSCGRLFDAVSALLGLVCCIDYEGQAAILLEKIQDLSEKEAYPSACFQRNDFLYFDSQGLFASVVEDVKKGTDKAVVSRRFHLGLARGLAEWAHEASMKTGIRDVALSGGVMQNLTMLELLPIFLAEKGLRSMVHSRLPANDGCISLGQAVYGQRLLEIRKQEF